MQQWMYKLQESKIFVATVGLLLVVWLGYNTTRMILRNYELVQQIENLGEEVAILELENLNLEYQIGYYKTDAFLELEARDKLNVVASGEKVLILPDDRYDVLELENSPTATELDPPAVSNLNAWLDFLLGGN